MKELVRYIVLPLLVVLLYGCQEEVLVERNDVQKPVVSAISFDRGLVETTRATSLSDYASTMGVWGYRNPDTDNELVFKNQLVSYNTTSNVWTYSPLKYWENSSLYDFYAYSPHNASVTIDTTISRAYYINISDVTLHGINLQETPSAEEKKIFRDVKDAYDNEDIDWMVARAAQKNISGALHNTVQFQMQHILSKLNIAMRVSGALTDVGTITLDALSVGELVCQGSFAQALDHTPTAEEVITSPEWTLDDTKTYTVSRTLACNLGTEPRFVLESLLLPQAIDAPACTIRLEYTIHYAATGHTEHFTYAVPLATVFTDVTSLGSGWNYTISFFINPASITFTANAACWADGESATLPVN